MRKMMLVLSAVFALTVAAVAEPQWLTDLPKAQALAKESKKKVLVNFTGSDWCGFCIKLHKDVFDTKEFADYAEKNLVLVEIDFPTKKAQSDELKKANKKLQDQFKVKGFPTVVILDSNGKKLGEEVGFGGGEPKDCLAKLDKISGK